MKKIMFLFASAIMMAFAACTSDNPVSIPEVPDTPEEPEEPEVVVSVSLKDIPFGSWSAWVDGELTNQFEPTWAEGESSGLPYGDGSVKAYSDLSAYSKLIVVATEGTPRFLLNRDVDEGQWNEVEADSHLIEYPKGDEVWSAKYFSVEEKEDGSSVYTVDLAQIVQDKGYAHLHAIKGANWVNCTLTSMVVVE